MVQCPSTGVNDHGYFPLGDFAPGSNGVCSVGCGNLESDDKCRKLDQGLKRPPCLWGLSYSGLFYASALTSDTTGKMVGIAQKPEASHQIQIIALRED